MASAETSVSVKMLRGEDLLPAISSRHQSNLGMATHGPSHCFAVVASLWNDSTYAPFCRMFPPLPILHLRSSLVGLGLPASQFTVLGRMTAVRAERLVPCPLLRISVTQSIGASEPKHPASWPS